MPATKYSFGGALLFLLLISACSSPRQKVAGNVDNLRERWQTNLAHQANLPERVIDWPTAVQLMNENNLKLRQTRIELTNAQESVKQVFKDLIPTLNFRAGVSKEISDLSALSPDDINFSADSFFSVPGVVNMRARFYAAKLYEMRTQVVHELTLREQMIDLYRSFFTAEELQVQRTRINTQRATSTAMEQVDPFTGRLLQTELDTAELLLARETKGLQDRVSELLGSRDYQWVLSPSGIPTLSYDQVPLPLDDTNRVAQLQIRLLAVELEAARAQLLGLKLRYWPELNIFISSPPLYSKSGGEERFWDSEQVRASADLFWNVDTRGSLSRSIRQTKRQQELQIERYRQESLTLINRLLFTQKLITGVRMQMEQVERELNVLLSIPPAQNYGALDKYAQDYRNLTQQQLQLKRELSELNALFWFVDENAWTSNSLLTPNT